MKASLQIKNSIYQVVISYKDEGKYKTKWITTGLREGTNMVAVENAKKYIVKSFEDEVNGVTAPEEPAPPPRPKGRPGRKKKSELPVKKDEPPQPVCFEFTEFLDMWLETVKPTIAYNTYKGYAKNLRRINGYFKPLNIRLDEIKPLHIQQFYSKMYSEGLSGSTVQHFHVNIRKALQYAMLNELINTNPADKVKRPKAKKYIASYYNKNELAQLFEVFKGDRLELCVQIAAYYGVRRSELIGLKWDAIDFENKTISIRHKVVFDRQNGKELFIGDDELKNVSSRRTLPLMPHIEKLLREEKAWQEQNEALMGDSYNKDFDGYVCRDKMGKLITPNYVTRHFKQVIDKNGLKHLRFHDLRHSCASLMLAHGVSMKEIQEWLGHSTYNVTANLYSHLDYSSKIASAAVITQVLG